MLSGFVKYPALVLVGETSIDRAKVIVHEGTAVAAVLDGAGQVQVVARLNGVTGYSTEGGGQVVVLTGEDGEQWKLERGSGCSCSSPLKRWDFRARPTASV